MLIVTYLILSAICSILFWHFYFKQFAETFSFLRLVLVQLYFGIVLISPIIFIKLFNLNYDIDNKIMIWQIHIAVQGTIFFIMKRLARKNQE